MNEYLAIIKKNKGIEIIKEEFGEPSFHQEEDVWSTYAEIEVVVEGIEKFVYICVSFTPASVEIIAPKKLTFTAKDLTDWLAELLSLLHEIGMKHKQKNMEVKQYITNLNALARNAIMLALDKPQSKKAIAEATGMNENLTQQFLDRLVKEQRVQKEGEVYQKR